jgi:hypothetical protein
VFATSHLWPKNQHNEIDGISISVYMCVYRYRHPLYTWGREGITEDEGGSEARVTMVKSVSPSGHMAQVVEHLPSKHENWDSIPST